MVAGPYQVGMWCYATPADAAAAACAGVVPSSSVSGASVVTLSCAGATPSGAMRMQASVAPVDGSASAVVSTVEAPVEFQPCKQSEWWDGAETVVVAAVAVLVPIWTYRQISRLLRWSRGDGV